MNKIQEYCEILGVSPGDSPDQVQKSFRAKIKQYHPDRPSASSDREKTTLLIEAYDALKKGVPTAGDYSDSYSSRRSSSTYQSAEAKTWPYRSYNRGYDVGKKIFTNLFQNTDAETFNRLHQKLYGFSPNFRTQEPEKKQQPQRSSVEPQSPNNPPAYRRAEEILKQIIARYHNNRVKFHKSWVRQYISELTQLQVIYRDVCRIHPAFTGKALRRVDEIHSLIAELKVYLHK